ncbi:MAG: lipase maturation factor family protein [Elusimicrobia bacterium]|nr:lipase maturation factor family protein [Elusimicrobiota bacterium]
MAEMNAGKPLLIYDGDCNFCKRWVGRWKSLTEGRIDYSPSQKVASQFPQIPPERFQASVIFVEPGGLFFSGAEAVFRTLSYVPGKKWILWVYRKVPGFAAVSEGFYRLVARRRRFFSKLTTWFWGNHLEPSTYYLSRWLFLRLLGLTYLIAFISFWTQMDGLVGDNGIWPAAAYLKNIRAQLGPERFRIFPTLLWLYPHSGFLSALCGAGVLGSILLVMGIFQVPVLFMLWAAYLSIVVAGGDFMSFQWDILLLETGLLSAFFAPAQLLPRLAEETRPSPLILWLLRWLLFRLVFSSGAVKLASGDETWRHLTALNWHFETQPLPVALAWYAHQLPHRLHKISTGIMFAIELAAPFFIFSPRRLRLLAFFPVVFLMLLIMLTGNYCFFNVLTVALCLLLLDDAALKPFLPKKWAARWDAQTGGAARLPARGMRAAALGMAALALVVTGVEMAGLFTRSMRLPAGLHRVYSAAAPFRSINSYGLFAVMTTARREIILEGSDDAKTWKAYEFRWKPGELGGRPGTAAPYQPRLDWQMWFAALGRPQDNPWFANFAFRLLEGSPEVLGLLKYNPFPQAPPRYLRAQFYDYHFTGWEEKRKTGNWWRRDLLGPYLPPVSLQRREDVGVSN